MPHVWWPAYGIGVWDLGRGGWVGPACSSGSRRNYDDVGGRKEVILQYIRVGPPWPSARSAASLVHLQAGEVCVFWAMYLVIISMLFRRQSDSRAQDWSVGGFIDGDRRDTVLESGLEIAAWQRVTGELGGHCGCVRLG